MGSPHARWLVLVLIVAQAIAVAAPRVVCLTAWTCHDPAPADLCCESSGPTSPAEPSRVCSSAGDRAEDAAPCPDDCGCCVTLAVEDRGPSAWPPKSEAGGMAAGATCAAKSWIGSEVVFDPPSLSRLPDGPCRGADPGVRSTRLIL